MIGSTRTWSNSIFNVVFTRKWDNEIISGKHFNSHKKYYLQTQAHILNSSNFDLVLLALNESNDNALKYINSCVLQKEMATSNNMQN